MKAEEAVEIEDLILRDGDAGTHVVVVLLAVGDDDVEAVGCATLEDDDQAAAGCGCGLGQNRANQEAGDGGGAGDGQGAVAQEESTVGLHDGPPFAA